MKLIVFLLSGIFIWINSYGQPDYFKENLQYRISVRSRIENLSDIDARKFLAMGDLLSVAVKNGNYKQSSSYSDIYTIQKDKKVYIKFRKLDTLYYLDFSSDTRGQCAPGRRSHVGNT